VQKAIYQKRVQGGGANIGPYAEIIFRTLLLYILILVIFRLMGKREIGELSLLDLVVFIMIAEMAAMAIDNTQEPLFHSLLPMLLLVAIQILLAFVSLKSKRFRDMMDGQPSIIINKGKIDEYEMRKQRYNFDDLLLQLREEGIINIADVKYAILEPSGKLSVFKKGESSDITLPLIIDGVIQEENLAKIKKTNLWLRQELHARGYRDIRQISFCNYDKKKLFIDVKDEM
jgi:uncharacterized membrane protein YcaP (DUF421 family)